MVSALQTTFVTKEIGFAPLFKLDDATLPIRGEQSFVFNTRAAGDWMDSSSSAFPSDGKRVLLEFARRMLPSGDPFQGQSDMLSVRVLASVDPHDAINDFIAALKAARTRATLLNEDVKTLFIKALDQTFYQPVVSRLLLRDQRAAHDLYTIQQWYFMERYERATDSPDSDIADLRTMVLDLKRQLAALTNSNDSPPAINCGFTPRAGKASRQMKNRDGLSAYSFNEEAENSVLAARFQHAIDNDNAEEFEALCVLAGGKPDIVADISACSFCEEDGEALISAIDEYTDMARRVDTGMLNVNTFTANVPVVSEAVTHSPAASVSSGEDWTAASHPAAAKTRLWEDHSWFGPLFADFIVAPPVGGAGRAASSALITTTLPPDGSPDEC
ncbi:hypothetical protein CYMTET_17861 [Cymbomonas tetramitiformis]|uniref:Uncharacterized protein n=1 Tax=Cymbomonas tetramitiformis TaxID=36881 RepID=A0AAE0G9A3_9CHLO|nr:hypothetical protein CYMTET_17861 [Cymbomonas tetramitiformis]